MQLDRQNLEMIRRDIDAAVAEIGKRHGLEIKLGNGKFTFHLKVSQGTTEGKQAVQAKIDSEWRLYAPSLGVDPTWLGKTFWHGNYSFKVVGLDIGRPKNCVKIVRSDGSNRICPPNFVRANLRVAA